MQDDSMPERRVATACSTGPEDTPTPSESDLDAYASGHVEYGEASCPPDDSYTLVFRDEAERLAFMD